MATARKRVPTPITQRWTRSRSPTPTTDPYICPTNNPQGWGRTLKTLREWRNFGQMPPSARRGESSTAQYEPILDTTPIIVNQMVIHENKLEIMEDAIMEMPGGEAFNELQERVDNAEGNISNVNDTAQSLREQATSNTSKLREIESMMNRMERKAAECHFMVKMAQGFVKGSPGEEHKEE